MRKIQTYAKLIEARCQTIACSPEADRNTNLKCAAKTLLTAVLERKNTSIETILAQNNLRDSKQLVKSQHPRLINLAVEGKRMLESIKPSSEVDTKSIKIKTQLFKMKSSQFLEECEVICLWLQKQTQQLLDYGYTPEQINQLSEALRQHAIHRSKLSAHMLAYTEIRSRRDRNDQQILEDFDRINQMVEYNMVLMPNLYRDYFIHKLPSYKRNTPSIVGTVTFNGKPAAGARIILYASPSMQSRTGKAGIGKDAAIYSKLTNVSGEFTINKLKPSCYHLIASKNGYEEQKQQLYVNPREVTSVSIELVPLLNQP